MKMIELTLETKGRCLQQTDRIINIEELEPNGKTKLWFGPCQGHESMQLVVLEKYDEVKDKLLHDGQMTMLEAPPKPGPDLTRLRKAYDNYKVSQMNPYQMSNIDYGARLLAELDKLFGGRS